MMFHSYSVKFLMFVFVCFFVTGCVVAFAVNRFLLNVTNLMTALVTFPRRGKVIASASLCMSVFLSTRISPKPFVQTPLSFMCVRCGHGLVICDSSAICYVLLGPDLRFIKIVLSLSQDRLMIVTYDVLRFLLRIS